MITVREILDSKGTTTYTINPDSTVYDAIAVLAKNRIGAMPVMDGDKLVGIFSERDYTTKIALMDKSSRDTKVSEIMTPDPISVDGDQKVSDCMRIMSEQHIRHLPVVEDGQLKGIISIKDLLTSMIKEKEYLIQQLETYISGPA